MFRFSSSDRTIFFEKFKKKKKIQDSLAKEANTLKCPCDHSIDVKCPRDQKIHSYFSLGLKTTNTKRPTKRPRSDHEATNVLCEKARQLQRAASVLQRFLGEWLFSQVKWDCVVLLPPFVSCMTFTFVTSFRLCKSFVKSEQITNCIIYYFLGDNFDISILSLVFHHLARNCVFLVESWNY